MLISLNDHPAVREVFSGFGQKVLQIRYTVRHKAGGARPTSRDQYCDTDRTRGVATLMALARNRAHCPRQRRGHQLHLSLKRGTRGATCLGRHRPSQLSRPLSHQYIWRLHMPRSRPREMPIFPQRGNFICNHLLILGFIAGERCVRVYLRIQKSTHQATSRGCSPCRLSHIKGWAPPRPFSFVQDSASPAGIASTAP